MSCKVSSRIENKSYKASSFNKTFVDVRDNSEYGIIEIEDQIWFAQNLRFKTPKSKCYKGKENNCNLFGRLYTNDELEIACPEGWRVPNIEDWENLKTKFDSDSIYALLDTLNWEIVDEHTNQSGLSLIGTGYQMERKLFIGKRKATTLWNNQTNKYDEFYHAHIYGGNGIYFDKSNFQTNEVFHIFLLF